MVSGKQLADFGYKAFSGSMMLLTIFGGYLCGLRVNRYFRRQKALPQLEPTQPGPGVIED